MGTIQGRVVQVRPERGEARIAALGETPIPVGGRGQVQSRIGPVDFRVVTTIQANEALVREERRGEFSQVRVGDTVFLYPNSKEVSDAAKESLEQLDRLLGGEPLLSTDLSEAAPDFLAEVTGETLDDYEAWLLQLEGESIAPPVPPVGAPRREEIPFYPDLKTHQTVRTGVDYDRFVFNATTEEGSPRRVEEQIGRFLRWRYDRSGDLWENHFVRFENDFEANDYSTYEEMSFHERRELPNGDSLWWDNRSIWKVFQNDQGDSYLLNDFETRYVKKLSDRWDWQTGLRAEWKREYDTETDDGYKRGTLLSEWNYRDGFDKWFDFSYEFAREVRNDPRNRPQDYWEHRLEAQYYLFGGDWTYDLFAESYYRDYNQPGSEQDEFVSLLTGSARRKLSDTWTLGLRTEFEPRFYPTTNDTNSNAVRADLTPFLEYASGGSLFLSLEPRVSQVFHFGRVSDDVVLGPTLPRKKSDGDYREAGLGFSLNWLADERWRLSLFQDVYHRWFPHGETGAIAFYLFDFPRLADSTNLYSSFSVDYLCSEDLELSFRVSHTRQLFRTFDDNDTSSFNAGIEAVYRF